jgi:hypothetical protein
MNMFLLPNYPPSPLYLQNPQLETRGRTTKTTHVLRQQKTAKNKSKNYYNTTQHSTPNILGRPRLETLLESKHPTKGKTFYTLNPKQQTNKTQPKSEKLITKATKTTLTPTAMEERLMSKYKVGY